MPKTDAIKLSDTIKNIRESLGYTQSELADFVGVSRLTISRWEKDSTEPLHIAYDKLLLAAKGTPNEDKLLAIKSQTQSDEHQREFSFGNKKLQIVPAPYVINAPEDQNSFHNILLNLQSHKNLDLPIELYGKRLSLVDSVAGIKTPQALLEKRKKTAKSWSSNYGPHGWHRYVGRFPSHLVRALINHFQAGPDDIILDPFAGSGTTLVEARMLGVKSIGIEVCPLSALISRTKAHFPLNGAGQLKDIVPLLEDFYTSKWDEFIALFGEKYTHADIIERPGNLIPTFANIEKWFSPEALLGTSIVVEFAEQQEGFICDAIMVALSGKMRSIGNVDVDVIRAEYRKTPRLNVDVLKIVKRQLLVMAHDIDLTVKSHEGLITDEKSTKVIEGSLLDAKIKPGSISHIITSPPYGVESLSYLRTHLLSYRALAHYLKRNPYDFSDKIIGSEYLAKAEISTEKLKINKISPTCISFFNELLEKEESKQARIRINMMIHFFEDMNKIVERYNKWLKMGGNIAFVVGNKRIGKALIPTDKIMHEIFVANGFEFVEEIKQKLKTNNSNSQVPWQERIIDEEFVLIFKKVV